MKDYSPNGQVPPATLQEAVLKGLAGDNGLYMPERIPLLSGDFFASLHQKTLQETALEVAAALFGDDIAASPLREMVYGALSFDIPLVKGVMPQQLRTLHIRNS
ncbi:MAG: hypothetical protein LBL94_11520 [Prevotellaceae bacterium]|jgi:threonine synthase|nr:hypothetical protein [Prevotellaceae bacterium]